MRDFTAGRVVNCSCAVQNDRFFRTIVPNSKAAQDARPDNPVSTSSRDGSRAGTSPIYIFPSENGEEDKGILYEPRGRFRRKFLPVIIASRR